MGHTAQAIRWAETSGLHLSDMHRSDWMAYLADRERAYLAFAWVAIMQGRAEVLPLLDSLAESTHTRDRKWRHLESLSLKVLALHSQGQPEKARHVLEQAIRLAEPDGFIRLFVDKGPTIAILLRDLPNIAPDYVRRLQNAFPSYQDLGRVNQLNFAPTQPPTTEPLAFDTLSSREIEVLHLMAAGLSNRQISESLVITEGTVKGHLHKIYRKLNAHSRTQAIAKARDYRLL
jgi:LuxR family maltose regulon positive regulatory protein